MEHEGPGLSSGGAGWSLLHARSIADVIVELVRNRHVQQILG